MPRFTVTPDHPGLPDAGPPEAPPEPDTTAATMIRPFPTPGPRIRLAYARLNDTGTPTGPARADSDRESLPRPWDPASCIAPDLRAELWDWLEQVVTWLNTDYTWDTGDLIPPCWGEHPHLIHELATVADYRWAAGNASTGTALEDWHRYVLPAFTARMRERLRTHCDQGHRDWPGLARAHRDIEHHASRRRRIDIDLAAVEDLHGSSGDADLAYIDLRTGAILST